MKTTEELKNLLYKNETVAAAACDADYLHSSTTRNAAARMSRL